MGERSTKIQGGYLISYSVLLLNAQSVRIERKRILPLLRVMNKKQCDCFVIKHQHAGKTGLNEFARGTAPNSKVETKGKRSTIKRHEPVKLMFDERMQDECQADNGFFAIAASQLTTSYSNPGQSIRVRGFVSGPPRGRRFQDMQGQDCNRPRAARVASARLVCRQQSPR